MTERLAISATPSSSNLLHCGTSKRTLAPKVGLQTRFANWSGRPGCGASWSSGSFTFKPSACCRARADCFKRRDRFQMLSRETSLLFLQLVHTFTRATERSQAEAVFAGTRGQEATDTMPLPPCELLEFFECHSVPADEKGI